MIELQFKEDGVWIHAEHKGKHGLLNLNIIVDKLIPTIVKQAFVGAINESTSWPPEINLVERLRDENLLMHMKDRNKLADTIEQLQREAERLQSIEKLYRYKCVWTSNPPEDKS